MEYILGFTGSSRRVTEEQEAAFFDFIKAKDIAVFCHGDCIGADAKAHDIIRSVKPHCAIEVFPPVNQVARAFKSGDVTHRRKEYLARNRDIAHRATAMVAMPAQMYEVVRSGTWSTVRYALKIGKQITVIFPDGTVAEDFLLE
jgi:hypothetical protein